MAIVIHDIGKNQYAYDHFRVGPTVKSKYLGPVDGKGRIRGVYKGDGVERAPIGTTTASLREIYNKAVRRKALEEGKTVAPVHREKPYEPPAKKVEKRVVTAKRMEMPKPTVKLSPGHKLGDTIAQHNVDKPFSNEKEADEFLDSLEPHRIRTRNITAYYMKDGEKVWKAKEIPPIVPLEITKKKEDAENLKIKKAEAEAEEKKKQDKHTREVEEALAKGEDVYTSKDLENLIDKYGIEHGESTDPSEKFTATQMKGFEDDLRDMRVKKKMMNLPLESAEYTLLTSSMSDDYWEREKQKTVIDNPDKAVEALITDMQYNTQSGYKNPRKEPLSREEAEKRAKDKTDRIKDFVKREKAKSEPKPTVEKKDHVIDKEEDARSISQNVDTIFKSEAEANKFLESIKKHQTKDITTRVHFMEDGYVKHKKAVVVPETLEYKTRYERHGDGSISKTKKISRVFTSQEEANKYADTLKPEKDTYTLSYHYITKDGRETVGSNTVISKHGKGKKVDTKGVFIYDAKKIDALRGKIKDDPIKDGVIHKRLTHILESKEEKEAFFDKRAYGDWENPSVLHYKWKDDKGKIHSETLPEKPFKDWGKIEKARVKKEEKAKTEKRKAVKKVDEAKELEFTKTRKEPKKEPGVKALTAKEAAANLKELKAEAKADGRGKEWVDMVVKANPGEFSTGVPKKELKEPKKKEEKIETEAEAYARREKEIDRTYGKKKEYSDVPYTKKEKEALKKKYGSFPKYPKVAGEAGEGYTDRRMTRAEIESAEDDHKDYKKNRVDGTSIHFQEYDKLFIQADLDNLNRGRGQDFIVDNKETFVENRIQRHQFYSDAGNVRTKPFTREKAEKAAQEEIQQIRTFTPWDDMTEAQKDKYEKDARKRWEEEHVEK